MERQIGVIASQHFPRPFEGPVRVRVTAVFRPARSWSQKKQREHLGRPHTQRPDFDNVMKAICDGLNRIAYSDDAQIAECHVSKVWGHEDKTVVIVEEMDGLGDWSSPGSAGF